MRSRSKSYGQFCPVAKASQILGERWNLLVVRELLLGSTRFSELQKALPKASPTILTKRLKELEFAVVIERSQARGSQYAEYRLSVSGQELGTLIDAMGTWAARWAVGRLQKEELDEYFLILDISRRIRRDTIPDGAATIGFRFRPGHGDPG
jgi:DNA-binding HxlR family transcriptional regulator